MCQIWSCYMQLAIGQGHEGGGKARIVCSSDNIQCKWVVNGLKAYANTITVILGRARLGSDWDGRYPDQLTVLQLYNR